MAAADVLKIRKIAVSQQRIDRLPRKMVPSRTLILLTLPSIKILKF